MTPDSQRGGTLLGLLIGLVLGLGLAVAVAVYVNKVPTPFSNKNPLRSSAQDVLEAEKNKDWNPNGVLQPKPPAQPPVQAGSAASGGNASPLFTTPSSNTRQSVPTPAVSADPLGDWVKAQSAQNKATVSVAAKDAFDYMVQAGAFGQRSDADALKAKLALLGMTATVSQQDLSGRVVYRVRLGPFNMQRDAERVRMQLQANDIDNTLVRVQR